MQKFSGGTSLNNASSARPTPTKNDSKHKAKPCYEYRTRHGRPDIQDVSKKKNATFLRIEIVAWSAERIPTAVFSDF
jgi:hypothetical protein